MKIRRLKISYFRGVKTQCGKINEKNTEKEIKTLKKENENLKNEKC